MVNVKERIPRYIQYVRRTYLYIQRWEQKAFEKCMFLIADSPVPSLSWNLTTTYQATMSQTTMEQHNCSIGKKVTSPFLEVKDNLLLSPLALLAHHGPLIDVTLCLEEQDVIQLRSVHRALHSVITEDFTKIFGHENWVALNKGKLSSSSRSWTTTVSIATVKKV